MNKKAKVLAIENEKGGTSKSTTAATLAYLLAKRGEKVLLLDFDGQGHASMLCGVKNPNSLEITISTLLNKVITDEPLPEPETYIFRGKNGVDLIPANSELFMLERNLINVDFREYVLAKYVETIKDRYSYIIIDTMPQIGTPMINVMMCADSIIIPTQAELFSAQGLSELLRHYRVIKRKKNNNLKIAGVLVTMDSERTKVSATINSMIEKSLAEQINIFKTRIPRSIKVAEASIYGKTICEYMPDNPAAVAYEKFVKEWLENERA
jgi:chromosome partitioning protein